MQAVRQIFIFNKDDHKSWMHAYKMARHAESLLHIKSGSFENAACLTDVAALIRTLCEVNKNRGHYNAALKWAKQSFVIQQQIHGVEAMHTDIAASLHALGTVCDRMGDYKGARTYHEQSLEMQRQVHGKEAVHANIATSLHALGTECLSMGDYKGARTYHEQSLAMQRQVHGKEAVHVWLQQLRLEKYQAKLVEMGAKSLQDVAEMDEEDLEEVGMAKLERKRFMRAAAAGVEVPMHTDIAASLHALGAVCSSMGDHKGARTYFEQSLALQRQVHG
jgi:tetratricopeptide (TPR) repeat protein